MDMAENGKLNRRGFLKGAVVAGGATMAVEARAQNCAEAQQNAAKAPLPTAAQHAAEHDVPAELAPLTTTKTGSDFMVDVCKTLNLDYMASCPGSTFRG